MIIIIIIIIIFNSPFDWSIGQILTPSKINCVQKLSNLKNYEKKKCYVIMVITSNEVTNFLQKLSIYLSKLANKQ